jgi:hypothetical protein
MEQASLVWLAADYHLPATYSCRVPMSSITSALALPGPGPATVRLALIRTATELFELSYVQSVLFPQICAMPLAIRPPERVALTPHVLRAYKVEDKTQAMTESPVSREMAHAIGELSIYLQVQESLEDAFRRVLHMIGYWGQTSSLAWCSRVENRTPSQEECVMPLRSFQRQTPIHPFFSCILSEFRDPTLTWDEVVPFIGKRMPNPLHLDVFVWPLIEVAQHGGGKLLERRAFTRL